MAELSSVTMNIELPKKTRSEKNEGIVNELLEILSKHEVKKEVLNHVHFLIMRTYLMQSKCNDDEARFYYFRKLFLELSNSIRTLPKNSTVDWQGLSDILYFYAFTFTYFTNHNYPSVFSEKEVTVRICDMPDPQRFLKSNFIKLFVYFE
jgi:hypothetical protein